MDGDRARARRVGAALRVARGTMSVVEASNRSGLSRQWWLDAEKGERRDSLRGVVTTVLRPENLAKAMQAVGGDVAAVFAVAELDPTTFVADATQPAGELAERVAELEQQVEWLLTRAKKDSARGVPRPRRSTGGTP